MNPVVVKVWPGCSEATVTLSPVEGRQRALDGDCAADARLGRLLGDGGLIPVGLGYAPRSIDSESARRARAAVRRYCRFNSLTDMVTFTFAGETPSDKSLGEAVHNFWKRFWREAERRFGEGFQGSWLRTYVWVVEFGKVSGRIHVHMAVPWWGVFGCVEVCEQCARPALRRVRDDVPVSGSFCVGCVWGLGFVGRPDGGVENNSDGRALSAYLSKYLAKDLGGSLGMGRQRYRVGQGAKPESVSVRVGSMVEGIELLDRVCTVERGFAGEGRITPSLEWEGYTGPPSCAIDWLGQVARGREVAE